VRCIAQIREWYRIAYRGFSCGRSASPTPGMLVFRNDGLIMGSRSGYCAAPDAPSESSVATAGWRRLGLRSE